ncbi:MAG: Na/Pi symporter [Verrucomicrobiota bacterium]
METHFDNPTTVVVLGYLILGLSLFFIGASFLSSGLKTMAGPRLRNAMSRLDGRPASSSFLGVVLGATAQSTSLASFIMSNMVSAEMIGLKSAMLVVLWSNLGPSVLVFLATIPMNIVTAYMMGLVGLGYYLGWHRQSRHRAWISAVLGLSLLLSGITHTKQAAVWMGSWELFRDVLEAGHAYGPILFLLAIGLAFVARSSAAVSVVVIAFAASGTLTIIDGIIMVLGANLGTGLVAVEMSREMKGPAKQLMVFQFYAKAVGVFVWLMIITLDAVMGTYWIRSFCLLLTDNVAIHLALEYLFLQLATAVSGSFLIPRLQKRLATRYPEPPEVDLARPKFIYPSAMEEPNSALWLIVRERLRVWDRIPRYLEVFEKDRAEPPIDPNVLHSANREVMELSQRYVVELIEHGTNWQVLQRGVNLERGYETLMAIDDAAYQLVIHAQNYLKLHSQSRVVRRYLEESVAHINGSIPTVIKVFKRFDDAEIEAHMVLIKGEHKVIDALAKEYFRGHRGYITNADRYAILDIASRFHRIVYLSYRMLVIAKMRVAWEQGTSLDDEEQTLSAVFQAGEDLPEDEDPGDSMNQADLVTELAAEAAKGQTSESGQESQPAAAPTRPRPPVRVHAGQGAPAEAEIPTRPPRRTRYRSYRARRRSLGG